MQQRGRKTRARKNKRMGWEQLWTRQWNRDSSTEKIEIARREQKKPALLFVPILRVGAREILRKKANVVRCCISEQHNPNKCLLCELTQVWSIHTFMRFRDANDWGPIITRQSTRSGRAERVDSLGTELRVLFIISIFSLRSGTSEWLTIAVGLPNDTIS